MSKTWKHRHGRRDHDDGWLTPGYERPFRPKKEPENITIEWALARMSEHIDFLIDGFVANGTLNDSEREEYADTLRDRVRLALPKYTPGEGGSCCHFLTVAIDREAMHIPRRKEVALRAAGESPIVAMRPEEAEELGFVSGAAVAETCGNHRELFFQMDMEAIRLRLTPTELVVFDMLLEGSNGREIAEAIGCTKGNVYNTHLPRIRFVCEVLGYGKNFFGND